MDREPPELVEHGDDEVDVNMREADQPGDIPARGDALPRGALVGPRPPLQFLRQPPLLKKDSDVDLYLRRFQAYTDSINADEEDVVHLLINAMSDEVLMAVERHLHENITYEELTDVLRRELGDGLENREEYKAKLRKALRSRGESVRQFYIRIYQLARRSYPGDGLEAVRNNAIRDAFICGIADAQVSARLRENQDNMTNEELLEFAILLVSCKTASQSRITQNTTVNAISSASPPGTNSHSSKLEPKIDSLLELMTINAAAQQAEKTPASAASPLDALPTPQYQYKGPKTSIGLPPSNPMNDNYPPASGQGPLVFQEPHQHGFQNFDFAQQYQRPQTYNQYYHQFRPRYQSDFRANRPQQYEYYHTQHWPPRYYDSWNPYYDDDSRTTSRPGVSSNLPAQPPNTQEDNMTDPSATYDTPGRDYDYAPQYDYYNSGQASPSNFRYQSQEHN